MDSVLICTESNAEAQIYAVSLRNIVVREILNPRRVNIITFG